MHHRTGWSVPYVSVPELPPCRAGVASRPPTTAVASTTAGTAWLEADIWPPIIPSHLRPTPSIHPAARLQITNRARNRTWYFYCGQWLDKKTGVERTLTASDTDPRANLITYKAGAGSWAGAGGRGGRGREGEWEGGEAAHARSLAGCALVAYNSNTHGISFLVHAMTAMDHHALMRDSSIPCLSECAQAAHSWEALPPYNLVRSTLVTHTH